jgi:Zn finger protein HypA/HybF involved in hydrogenase expression
MKCPECGKRGLKGHAGVAMHIGRVHSHTIPTSRHRRRKILPARVQVEDHVDHAEANGGTAVALKRTTREVTVTEEATIQTKKFAVNGCPNCFFPVGLMYEDLAARKIAQPPYCPNCTCPLTPVQTALNLTLRQPNLAHAHA